MAALSASRQTPSMGQTKKNYAGQVGSTTIYPGGIVMINSGGFARPGATATGMIGAGVARHSTRTGVTWANTGADGAVNVEFDEGIFGFANSAAADLIANDDVGKVCYIVDDQTVAITNGTATRSPAGRVYKVEGSVVYVEMGVTFGRAIEDMLANVD